MAVNQADLEQRLAVLRQDYDAGKPVLDDLRRVVAALREHAAEPPLNDEEKAKAQVVRNALAVGALPEAGTDDRLAFIAEDVAHRVLGPSLIDQVTERLDHLVADIRRDQAEIESLAAETARFQSYTQLAERYGRLLDRLLSDAGRGEG
ncbi:MAG: hypothetical protein AB7G62_00695 [Magnetospirillum sp.]